mgnify:FL=1
MYDNSVMESIYCQKFAKNLKKIRESKGYSKSRLCELVGCDISYIGRIESCKKFPTLKMIFKLAIALEVPAKDLFDFE